MAIFLAALSVTLLMFINPISASEIDVARAEGDWSKVASICAEQSPEVGKPLMDRMGDISYRKALNSLTRIAGGRADSRKVNREWEEWKLDVRALCFPPAK